MTQTMTSRSNWLRPWATIAAAAGAALIVWVLSVPVAGVELVVGSGPSRQSVGPGAVAVVSLLAGGAAWALLAFLAARFRGGRRAWRITAWAVLTLSLLGPVGTGATGGVLATLLAMHMVVGMTLIVGLARPGR
ncbi:DUF6069 family protein [Micromonospora sp. CPCC 206061]|uniref:DUF6069 family protein n=1 Tax=Micromonospora sp. CPCC 206061 TaxID=3122410 RepID=UPI002FEEDCA3